MRLAVGVCPSLTAEVVSKLEACKIRSIRDLLLRDCEDLAKESSVSYKELRSIRRVAFAHHSAFSVSGQDLLHEAILTTRLFSTGCKELDRLLGGGLTTGEVVEVCGHSGEGKTSLCVHLALHAALELGISVLYVDTVGGINPLRMNPIVEALPQDLELVDEALSRIKVVAASDVWELFNALSIPTQPFVPVRRGRAGPRGAQGGIVTLSKIKLVIVDSLAFIMTPLVSGESAKQGMAILNELAVRLMSVAKGQQLAVVVVNSVVEAGSRERHTTAAKHKYMPALGKFWRCAPHIRLYVKRATDGTHTPLLVNAASENSCVAPQSPLKLKVAVWKGTRLKSSRTVVTLPKRSSGQPPSAHPS